jgi:uncharacterized protein
MHEMNLMYPFSGFLVGLLVGLTGVGGGSLMTPLLVLLFRIHPTTAVGTDLLYAAATKSVGTLMHSAHNSVDWKVVRRLAMGSIPATAAMLFLIGFFGPQSKSITQTITFVLGIALLLTAISIFFRRNIVEWAQHRFGEPDDRQAMWATIVAGVVLGALVSLTSVGAGALGMPVLLTLYPRLPVVRLVGSDIAHAVPLTLLAGVGHWALGDVNMGLFGSLLIGSIPGIIVGSLLAQKLPERGLQPVLAAVLLLVGGRLVF